MGATPDTPHWLNLDDIDDDELVTPAPDDSPSDPPTAPADAPRVEPPVPATPEAPEDEDASDPPTPVAAPTDGASPPPETTPPTTPIPEVAEPLVLTANRKQITLDGVTRTSAGLQVASGSVQRVTDLLRRGIDAETVLVPENTALRRQLREVTQARSAKEVEAETLITQLDAILDAGPDAAAAFLENYFQHRPILKARAIEAAANHRVAQMERQSQPDPEEYIAGIEQEARDVLAGIVSDAAKAAGLDETETEALKQRYGGRLASFVVQVPHDMPEHGLHAGQYALQQERLSAELQYDIGLRTDARTARQAAERAQQQAASTTAQAAAAAKNAATLAHAGKKSPANPKLTPAKAGSNAQSKQAWMQDLLSDDDED